MNHGRRNILAAMLASAVAVVCWPFKSKAAPVRPAPQFKPLVSARLSIHSYEPRYLRVDLNGMPTRSTPQARDFCRCVLHRYDAAAAARLYEAVERGTDYVIPYRLATVTKNYSFDWTVAADVAIFLHLDLIFDLDADEYASWSRVIKHLFLFNPQFANIVVYTPGLSAEYNATCLRNPRL